MHTTVLLNESIEGLQIKSKEIFVDATINGGGHSEDVAKKYGDSVKIIGIDMDEDALEKARLKLEKVSSNFILEQSNFKNINEVLEKHKIKTASKILFDLGLSSRQLEESGRGFSFQKDEPLLMTFKKKINPDDITAREIVNEWDEENIKEILRGYGEEKFSGRIARGIAEEREKKPIESTFQLVEIIRKYVPSFYRKGKRHFATKTFQALRIAVNNELNVLKEALEKSFAFLAPQGRIAVISFHSLEDRIVKNFNRELKNKKVASILTKKPIIPSDSEIKSNPRSRSAKLRIIEKI